jgi:uncharacterized cupin superfamily protein
MEGFGTADTAKLSDAGGLTQFGAHVQTLQPGARSANRHWHEKEDELLYVLSGEVTVIEDDGPHTLYPGDSAVWAAGVPNGHHAINQSSEPCSYLVVGTRLTHDVCHYPDSGRTLYSEGATWRILESDGTVFKTGRY